LSITGLLLSVAMKYTFCRCFV